MQVYTERRSVDWLIWQGGAQFGGKPPTSKADPRQQQDWFLECLQGGRAHPLAASGVATLCCSPPTLLETETLGLGWWGAHHVAGVELKLAVRAGPARVFQLRDGGDGRAHGSVQWEPRPVAPEEPHEAASLHRGVRLESRTALLHRHKRREEPSAGGGGPRSDFPELRLCAPAQARPPLPGGWCVLSRPSPAAAPHCWCWPAPYAARRSRSQTPTCVSGGKTGNFSTPIRARWVTLRARG